MLHTKLFTGQNNPPQIPKNQNQSNNISRLRKAVYNGSKTINKKFLQGSVSFARKQKDVERNRIGVLVRWQTMSCYCVTQWRRRVRMRGKCTEFQEEIIEQGWKHKRSQEPAQQCREIRRMDTEKKAKQKGVRPGGSVVGWGEAVAPVKSLALLPRWQAQSSHNPRI